MGKVMVRREEVAFYLPFGKSGIRMMVADV